MKKYLVTFVLVLSVLTFIGFEYPSFAHAAASGSINLTVLQSYKTGIITFINQMLIPVLMAIAFAVFLWGVFKYFIWGATNETDKGDGRMFVMWSLIGFVIILSVWGLVAIVTNFFNLTPGGVGPTPPTL